MSDDGSNSKNAPTEGARPESTEDKGTANPASNESGTEPEEDDFAKVKRQANHWQAEAKKATKRQAEIESELEKFREAQKSEQEKAIDQARKAGMDEATKEWQPKYVGLIRRNAALSMLGGAVKAPELVLPHLGLDDIEVDEEGQVDQTALKLAVERVLDEYPFLAQDAPSPAPTHHGDMGPRKNSPKGKHDPDELLRTAFRR